jgi:hypothetical protein
LKHLAAEKLWRLLEKNGPSAGDIKRLNVIEISLWEIDYRAAAMVVENYPLAEICEA